MTSTKLTDLMRRQAEELDPASSQRILNDALRGGARRRLRRHLVVGATAATVLAAITTGTGLAMSGGPSRTDNERPDVSATSPSAATAYDPGSETEVPDGPVIETDRKIVGDAVLLAVTRDLLPANGVVTDLDVAHIESPLPPIPPTTPGTDGVHPSSSTAPAPRSPSSGGTGTPRSAWTLTT